MTGKMDLVALMLCAVIISACGQFPQYVVEVPDIEIEVSDVKIDLRAIDVVRGSGNVVTEKREVAAFDRVDLSGGGWVIIAQGDEEALIVETDDNLMPYIKTDVRSGTLEIGVPDEAWDKHFEPSNDIIYRLSVTDLTALDLSGTGSIEIEELEADHLEVSLSGAGRIAIDALIAADIETTIRGVGSVELAGQVVEQMVELAGVGSYEGSDLKSRSATVRSSGVGSVVVWTVDNLDANVSGVGSVSYYGSPDVRQAISGICNLIWLGVK